MKANMRNGSCYCAATVAEETNNKKKLVAFCSLCETIQRTYLFDLCSFFIRIDSVSSIQCDSVSECAPNV